MFLLITIGKRAMYKTDDIHVKQNWYTRVHLFFLFLLQNIYGGYSLEPPRRGGSNVYPQSMFGAKLRKIFFFPVKILIFTTKIISVYCLGVFS